MTVHYGAIRWIGESVVAVAVATDGRSLPGQLH